MQMEITSFIFYAFVGISLLIYWKLPRKSQWKLLLADSAIFYCLNAKPWTLVYLAASVISVYLATGYFQRVTDTVDEKGDTDRKKRVVLLLTIALNIGILSVLKYTNLAVHTFNHMARGRWTIQEVNWAAPLAVSFYTLQLLAYLLDCYWGIARPEKNVGKLILYTAYFPQMVSGPISRYSDIGTQLFEKHEFDYDRVVHGLKRIAWGLLKKLAVSNRVAVIVNSLWEDPGAFSGFYIWIAAVGFVIQLYTDFSGCMDIVLGVSECFGIYLPENFNAPLLSRTVQEFWRRWHITLGQWLRDYIMNPLAKSDAMVKLGVKCKKKFGKKRGKKIPVYLSMLVLWLCMGIWHGDSWKYILGEGLWFWFVIVVGQVLKEPLDKVKRTMHIKENNICWQLFQTVRTFALVAIGFLFFRAESLMDAVHRIMLGTKFTFDIPKFIQFARFFIQPDMGGKLGFLIMTLSFILIFIVDICKYFEVEKGTLFFERHKVIRWVGYYGIALFLVLSLNIGVQEFAYAQF